MTDSKRLTRIDLLSDFEDLKLSEAERQLVTQIHEKSRAQLGGEAVRAEVLRRLCLIANSAASSPHGRLSIQGGIVEGDLDLVGLRFDFGLRFEDTRLEWLLLNDTRLLALELLGGRATGVHADRVEIAHDLVMARRFVCNHGVGLRSAVIGGDLNLGGARLEAQEGSSLNFDGARIGARVFLRVETKATGRNRKRGLPFHATRPVRGRNARVAGGILCKGGRFDRELDLTRTQVGGDVSLVRAQIGIALKPPGKRPEAKLNLRSMHIAGTLSLRGLDFRGSRILLTRTQVDGSLMWSIKRNAATGERLRVDLRQARVGYLDDDPACWHGAEVALGGFSLGGIAVGGGDWLEQRKDWLRRQPPGKWSPHPYDQVRAALRDMGHETMAREIAIERENIRLDRGNLGKASKVVHGLYGELLGFGYKPLKLFLVSALVIAVCAAIFCTIDPCKLPGTAASCGGFVTPSKGAAPYDPLLFSLDAFAPIDLGQAGAWQPKEAAYSYLIAIETSLGWLFTALLLGAVTGVLRRD